MGVAALITALGLGGAVGAAASLAVAAGRVNPAWREAKESWAEARALGTASAYERFGQAFDVLDGELRRLLETITRVRRAFGR